LKRDEIEREVAKVRWYHSIDLGQGIITPGVFDTRDTLGRLGLPADLGGQTVLDVGAWDGFYSFEAERRGASRVLATDHFCWSGPGWGTKAGFDCARKVLDSKVEDLDIDVLDLSPEKAGIWDVVLFLGVLYHLPHPLLALERVASVTGKRLVLETHVDMLWTRHPALAFYPGEELDGDPTNWFGPNIVAVKAMLAGLGFRTVEVVSRYSMFRRLGRAVKWSLTRRGNFFRTANQGRVVIHATR
jgi:tRNA (mo5U34)-methyltransferase